MNNFAWKVFPSALLLCSRESPPGSSSALRHVYLKQTDLNRNFSHVTRFWLHTHFTGPETLEYLDSPSLLKRKNHYSAFIIVQELQGCSLLRPSVMIRSADLIEPGKMKKLFFLSFILRL